MNFFISIAAVAIFAFSPAPSMVPTEADLQCEREDTAECLSKCNKQYRQCSDNGTKNVVACVAKRKKCYDACK